MALNFDGLFGSLNDSTKRNRLKQKVEKEHGCGENDQRVGKHEPNYQQAEPEPGDEAPRWGEFQDTSPLFKVAAEGWACFPKHCPQQLLPRVPDFFPKLTELFGVVERAGLGISRHLAGRIAFPL